MKQLTIKAINGKFVTDSREVADMTGKRHSDLIRDIDGYKKIIDQNADLRSDDFFIESSYSTGTGKKYRCFDLTKIGCDMVANKMTGEKGILFTATYVTRFEEMERKIVNIETPSYMINDPVERAKKWISEEEGRQQLEKTTIFLQQKVFEFSTKITYLDTILQSKATVTTSQIGKDYGLTGQELNKILQNAGIQYKLNGQWLLYKKYADKGYTQSSSIPITRSGGNSDFIMNTRWTQRGRLFIHELLTSLGIKANIEKEYPDVK